MYNNLLTSSCLKEVCKVSKYFLVYIIICTIGKYNILMHQYFSHINHYLLNSKVNQIITKFNTHSLVNNNYTYILLSDYSKIIISLLYFI